VKHCATGKTRWYYLKAETAAHAGPVGSAVLRVRFQGAKGVTTPLVVKAVNSSWTEAGLTWITKPVPGSQAATGSVVGNTAAWRDLDVTSYVNAERAAGRTVVGFVIQAGQASSALVKASSGESSASTRPHLVLTP